MIEELVKEYKILKEDFDKKPPFRECVDYACELYKQRTDDYDPCRKEICPRLS